MLIDRLTEFANAQYQEPYASCRKQVSPRCPLKNCVMSEYIKNSCNSSSHTDSYQCECCLDEIHYRQVASSYSCPNSCFVYVCKYIHKYASEIYKALEEVNLPNNRTINVLSLGCGPASELCALDKLVQEGTIDSFNYLGADLNPNWSHIHDFYQTQYTEKDSSQVSFDIDDAKNYLSSGFIGEIDVIIFNYFLSDMIKFTSKANGKDFLEQLSTTMSEINTYPTVVLNDIALINYGSSSTDLVGEILCLPEFYSSQSLRYFSSNSTARSGKFLEDAGFMADTDTSLVFEIPDYCDKYNPYKYLGSAQIILQQR